MYRYMHFDVECLTQTIEKDDGEQIIMVKRPDKHFLYCFLLPIPPLWMCACCELFNSVVEVSTATSE